MDARRRVPKHGTLFSTERGPSWNLERVPWPKSEEVSHFEARDSRSMRSLDLFGWIVYQVAVSQPRTRGGNKANRGDNLPIGQFRMSPLTWNRDVRYPSNRSRCISSNRSRTHPLQLVRHKPVQSCPTTRKLASIQKRDQSPLVYHGFRASTKTNL